MITSMYKKYEHTIVISNRALVQGDFFEQMQKVICLHPHAVILREKDLPDEEYKMLAEKVLDMCREEDVNSFLHSRISIAKSLDCGRIHLSIPVLKSIERRGTKKSQKRFSGNQCFLSQYGGYEDCCKKRSHADYPRNDL